MNLFQQIIYNYSSWFKLWLVAFLLLFFGKIYERNYIQLNHDHGHFLKLSCEQDLQRLIKSHSKLLRQIPKFKDDYAQVSNIILQLNTYLKNSSEFENDYILICDNERLLYWNKEETFYDRNWCPCFGEEGRGFFDENSKYYFGLKSEVSIFDSKVCITHYTRVLRNENDPSIFELLQEKKNKDDLSIQDSQKKVIGYITNSGSSLSTLYSNYLLVFYLLILLCLYIPFHIFSKEFFIKNNFSWGVLIWLSGALISISISQWMVYNTEFYDSILTHSKINTSIKQYTLFEFLIICSLIFHLAYVFNKYYNISFQEYKNNHWIQYLIPLLNYICIVLSIAIYCSSFKSVFSNSSFNFDLDRLLFMPAENYIMLISLILLLLSIFLISHKLNLSTLTFQLKFKQRFLLQVGAFVIISSLYSFFKLEIHIATFITSAFIFILLQDFFIDYKQNNILWLISWILVISFLTSGLVFHYQNIKKRYQKNSLVENLKSIQYESIDSTETTISKSLSTLISQANALKLDLYVYEDDVLKYSTNFLRPDIFWAKRSLGNSQSVDKQISGLEYQITRIKPNFIIVTSHKIPSIIKAISLFSYLFTTLILISYLLSLLNQRYNLLPESLQIRMSDKPSLRNRIQFYVILSIVISFLTIALVTVFFTRRSEQEITSENLTNKIKYFAPDLERSILNYSSVEDANLTLTDRIRRSLSLFDYKIEYFDNEGFEKTLNPQEEKSKFKLCDPGFYFQYQNNNPEIVLNKYKDHEGNIQISALRNILLNNQKIGTLKMSTGFAAATSGDNRLTNLINTLLNIYVFLFLISASLATFLASSITSPLNSLSTRIKMMRLGKKNEPLEWNGQDEIGVLINDYNRMVEQLDESVEMLAKSERDSAWREMAKQVAHEIKNPLTPMKLNVQYLQQQIKSGQGDITELAKNVSESLLEQIEGLTQIATEFSNFAKMPTAANEKVLINDLISSVHDLFRKRDDIDILLTIPIDELYVYCDRNQLVRVLNNLINNAIQAIPDNIRGKILIQLERKGNKAIVSIKDNGIGIPEEMRPKIFLPNFTTKTSGTGLGLAMCQQIVESVNGHINFTSVLQEGTTFYVYLPLMKDESDLV
ncbi:MAG: HAMP domain-containing histidine kinase [Saprospiraceae bacterium]|nr:HAMP domain-containing histidine kinase [Saprospiraceae bacterium]